MEVPHAVDVTACCSIAQIGIDVLRVLMCSDLGAVCFEERNNLCVTVSRRVIEWCTSPAVGAVRIGLALQNQKLHDL